MFSTTRRTPRRNANVPVAEEMARILVELKQAHEAATEENLSQAGFTAAEIKRHREEAISIARRDERARAA